MKNFIKNNLWSARDLKEKNRNLRWMYILTRIVIQSQISRTIRDKPRETSTGLLPLERVFYFERARQLLHPRETRGVLSGIRMLLIVPVRFDSSRLPTGKHREFSLEARISAPRSSHVPQNCELEITSYIRLTTGVGHTPVKRRSMRVISLHTKSK